VPPLKESSQLPLRTTMPAPPSAGKHRAGPPDPHRIDDDDDEDDNGDNRLFGVSSGPRSGPGSKLGGGGGGGPRQPPPVQAALPSPVRSSTHPSVSLEQAARPSFQITVGDPHKVGDLTSSHIVYSVRTKVCVFYGECV
jgi:sorting nexin-1/2